MQIMDEITIFVGPKDGMEAQPTQEKFNRLHDERLKRVEGLLQDLRSAGLLKGLDAKRPGFNTHIMIKGNRDRVQKVVTAVEESHTWAKCLGAPQK